VVFLPPAIFGSMIFARATHDAGNALGIERVGDSADRDLRTFLAFLVLDRAGDG
jgi:hypothetical protein